MLQNISNPFGNVLIAKINVYFLCNIAEGIRKYCTMIFIEDVIYYSMNNSYHLRLKTGTKVFEIRKPLFDVNA